jgi:hypothetical protein
MLLPRYVVSEPASTFRSTIVVVVIVILDGRMSGGGAADDKRRPRRCENEGQDEEARAGSSGHRGRNDRTSVITPPSPDDRDRRTRLRRDLVIVFHYCQRRVLYRFLAR